MHLSWVSGAADPGHVARVRWYTGRVGWLLHQSVQGVSFCLDDFAAHAAFLVQKSTDGSAVDESTPRELDCDEFRVKLKVSFPTLVFLFRPLM